MVAWRQKAASALGLKYRIRYCPLLPADSAKAVSE
jgi:hypothetical protein